MVGVAIIVGIAISGVVVNVDVDVADGGVVDVVG